MSLSQPQSQIRHGDKSPQAFDRERAQMFGTEIRPGRDVCGHRALLYSKLCGRGSAFFSLEAELRHYKRWPSCMTCLSVKPLAESDVQ